MDPVTTAIVAALSAGAVAGLTDTVKTAITDAYNKLKGQLTKKHGKDSDIVKAVEKLEAKPDSKARKDMLAEEIATAKAEQDDEILTAANQILVLVKSQQANTGKFNIQVTGNVQGVSIGDHQSHTQYFGKMPDA